MQKLIVVRIDRYTRAAQSSTNNLTKSNLQPGGEVPQTPKSFQGTHQGSPVQSTHTQPSASHGHEQGQVFSTLPPGALYPAQQARLNPSGSAADVASLSAQPGSPTSTKESGNFDRPRRTSSMTIHASTVSAAQPPQSPPEDQGASLTRTTSSVTLDGEPRIFPGVVSRGRRRSSMRTGQQEESDGVAAGTHSGFKKGEVDDAVAERDTDDEE